MKREKHAQNVRNSTQTLPMLEDDQPISMVSKDRPVSIDLSSEQPISMVKKDGPPQAKHGEHATSASHLVHGMPSIYGLHSVYQRN